jgi:type III secretion system SsaH family protein
MNVLDLSNPKRLVVECAFAAASHGIRGQLEPMLAAMPFLLTDKLDLSLAMAFLLFGAGNDKEAQTCIRGIDDPRAELLRLLFNATASCRS